MTVVDDVTTKIGEIEVKVTFLKTLAGKANNPQWLPGDAAFTAFKSISDVQAVLLETLAAELAVLTGGA